MKTKSILTDYEGICSICGKQANVQHHLIFGRGMRNLAEEDGLKIPLCNDCHNMALFSVHGNQAAEKLSKMLGQMAYEAKIGTREDFRKRYGRSYL